MITLVIINDGDGKMGWKENVKDYNKICIPSKALKKESIFMEASGGNKAKEKERMRGKRDCPYL